MKFIKRLWFENKKTSFLILFLLGTVFGVLLFNHIHSPTLSRVLSRPRRATPTTAEEYKELYVRLLGTEVKAALGDLNAEKAKYQTLQTDIGILRKIYIEYLGGLNEKWKTGDLVNLVSAKAKINEQIKLIKAQEERFIFKVKGFVAPLTWTDPQKDTILNGWPQDRDISTVDELKTISANILDKSEIPGIKFSEATDLNNWVNTKVEEFKIQFKKYSGQEPDWKAGINLKEAQTQVTNQKNIFTNRKDFFNKLLKGGSALSLSSDFYGSTNLELSYPGNDTDGLPKWNFVQFKTEINKIVAEINRLSSLFKSRFSDKVYPYAELTVEHKKDGVVQPSIGVGGQAGEITLLKVQTKIQKEVKSIRLLKERFTKLIKGAQKLNDDKPLPSWSAPDENDFPNLNFRKATKLVNEIDEEIANFKKRYVYLGGTEKINWKNINLLDAQNKTHVLETRHNNLINIYKSIQDETVYDDTLTYSELHALTSAVFQQIREIETFIEDIADRSYDWNLLTLEKLIASGDSIGVTLSEAKKTRDNLIAEYDQLLARFKQINGKDSHEFSIEPLSYLNNKYPIQWPTRQQGVPTHSLVEAENLLKEMEDLLKIFIKAFYYLQGGPHRYLQGVPQPQKDFSTSSIKDVKNENDAIQTEIADLHTQFVELGGTSEKQIQGQNPVYLDSMDSDKPWPRDSVHAGNPQFSGINLIQAQAKLTYLSEEIKKKKSDFEKVFDAKVFPLNRVPSSAPDTPWPDDNAAGVPSLNLNQANAKIAYWASAAVQVRIDTIAEKFKQLGGDFEKITLENFKKDATWTAADKEWPIIGDDYDVEKNRVDRWMITELAAQLKLQYLYKKIDTLAVDLKTLTGGETKFSDTGAKNGADIPVIAPEVDWDPIFHWLVGADGKGHASAINQDINTIISDINADILHLKGLFKTAYEKQGYTPFEKEKVDVNDFSAPWPLTAKINLAQVKKRVQYWSDADVSERIKVLRKFYYEINGKDFSKFEALLGIALPLAPEHLTAESPWPISDAYADFSVLKNTVVFLKESEAEAKVRNLIIDVNNAGIRLEFLLSKDIFSLIGKEKKPADVPLYLNGQHFELHREKHNDKKSFWLIKNPTKNYDSSTPLPGQIVFNNIERVVSEIDDLIVTYKENFLAWASDLKVTLPDKANIYVQNKEGTTAPNTPWPIAEATITLEQAQVKYLSQTPPALEEKIKQQRESYHSLGGKMKFGIQSGATAPYHPAKSGWPIASATFKKDAEILLSPKLAQAKFDHLKKTIAADKSKTSSSTETIAADKSKTSSSTATSTDNESSSSSKSWIIGLAVSTGILFLSILALIVYFFSKRKNIR